MFKLFKKIIFLLNIFSGYSYTNEKIIFDKKYSLDYSITENYKININTSFYLNENNFYEIKFYNSYSVVGYRNNGTVLIDSYDEFPYIKNNNYIFKKDIRIRNDNLMIMNFTSYFDNKNIILSTGKYNLTHFEKKIIQYHNTGHTTRMLANTAPKKFIIDQTSDLSDYYLFFGFYSMLILYFIFNISIVNNTKIHFFNKIITKLNINYGTFLTICLFGIFWICCLVYSFSTHDYPTILQRLGLWESVNLASVLFPVTRNSVFMILIKCSYKNCLLIHKLLVILLLISVIIKFAMILVYFKYTFLFEFINIDTGGSPLMGTIATMSMLLTGLFSQKIIREKYFEVFYYFHKIFVLITFTSSCLHFIIVLYYTLPAICLYFTDIILRYLNTRKAIYTKLKNIGNEKYGTSCVFIHVSLLKNIKTEPGSYFFICYKDVSRLQWHPLTVISSHDNNLIFCAKNMGKGTWTDNLINFNNSLVTQEQKLLNKEVYLQGPYGHLSINYKNNKYKYIINIAGGIGITPILSVLEDININKNKLIKVLFIWIVSHTSIVDPFSKNIQKLN